MLRILTALIMSIIVISGCSSSDNEMEGNLEENQVGQQEEQEEEAENEEPEETTSDNEGDLTLQVLKMDEAEGVTIENSDIYSGLDAMISADPTIGADEDFTVRTMDIYNTEDGAILILLGINRLDAPIKDITFDLTLGNDSGDYVWEDLPIELSEEKTGVIEQDSAVPILRMLSAEEEELLRTIDASNIKLLIENFDFEKVE